MANFFQEQAAARKRTRLLLVYFAAATLFTCLGVYALVAGVRWFFSTAVPRPPFFDPDLFAYCTVPVILIIGTGTILKLLELRQGAPKIMHALGAKRIHPNTADRAERRLYNVVEEMAVASGIAVPPVYVMKREQGINALAAGFTPESSAIAVTVGAMHHLDRDELQSMIAHEFGHILTGDARLNMYLIGILHGIQGMGLLGMKLLVIRTYNVHSGREQTGIIPHLVIPGGDTRHGWLRRPRHQPTHQERDLP